MLKLYQELASWWPLLSAPEEYAEEAAFFKKVLLENCELQPHTLLELGSGGGNSAAHLKAHFQMTLVDLSRDMLQVSAALNPECEHLAGDMRTVRLNRVFDAVLIHDAIMYMTTEEDLSSAMATAFTHCRPGGVALFSPDFVRETFSPGTEHGGHDGEQRAMRYLEWTYDPNPTDSTYFVELVYLLREADGSIQVEHDRHIEGLFSREVWLHLLRHNGFAPRVVVDSYGRDIFVAHK